MKNNEENSLKTGLLLYNDYKWLLDSYIVDFFTDNHWSKLSSNWQSSFNNLSSEELASVLDYNESTTYKKVWPLSFLALKTILVKLSLSREAVEDETIEAPSFSDDVKVMKLFWKNVKAKKRHEIWRMSKLCYQSAKDTDCFHIVDVGSGLGHLSRMLNYGYNFQVCTIEAQTVLSQQAIKLDENFENVLSRRREISKYRQTEHLNLKLENEITPQEFNSILRKAFKIPIEQDLTFGIVGLHPCGDLGVTLLKLFNSCSNAKFINIVGCCYQKLTSSGFPLSKFCQNSGLLSYHSREVACHAIENYVQKIYLGEAWRLKIHTFRALIEKIIINIDPQLGRSALNNVKYSEGMTFEQYCEKATSNLKINIALKHTKGEEIEDALAQWKKVVVFYSLRLLFAPLIETIILLDRCLSIRDKGNDCTLIPLFDPAISPRNLVLTAQRNFDS